MRRRIALLIGLALALPLLADPPDILLANVYRGDVDVAQYLVSEKLDGVRVVWDGRDLRFRSGRMSANSGWAAASPMPSGAIRRPSAARSPIATAT